MADGVLRLRPATAEDSNLLLAWRNDPETRRQSKTSDVITLAEHEAWLGRVLGSEGTRLRIAVSEAAPVGTVRADNKGAYWVLSWAVAPSARGRNVGFRMVALMIRELDSPVRAEIKPGNAASLRMAERLGMSRLADEDGMTVWALDR